MMKGAVISLGSTSSQWIVDAMRNYFDEAEHVKLKDLCVELTGKGAVIHCKGGTLPHYDCLYLRGSFRYMSLLIALSTALWDKTYMPLEPRSFSLGHDKFLTHLALLQHRVPQPKTHIVPNLTTAKRILKDSHYPIILKIPSGTQGKGVMFVESYAAAASTLDMLEQLKQPLLIQEYIDTDSTDLRALVVGGKVAAAMQRIGKKDDKRANIHQGGKGKSIHLTGKAKKIALRAAESIGADICAVDMLDTPLGPLVIEINLSPGLQGITKATDKDVAGMIARYLYERGEKYHRRQKHTKASELLEELETAGQAPLKQIIISARMRGDHLLLPEIVSTLSKLKDHEELVAEVTEGEIRLKRL